MIESHSFILSTNNKLLCFCVLIIKGSLHTNQTKIMFSNNVLFILYDPQNVFKYHLIQTL